MGKLIEKSDSEFYLLLAGKDFPSKELFEERDPWQQNHWINTWAMFREWFGDNPNTMGAFRRAWDDWVDHHKMHGDTHIFHTNNPLFMLFIDDPDRIIIGSDTGKFRRISEHPGWAEASAVLRPIEFWFDTFFDCEECLKWIESDEQ